MQLTAGALYFLNRKIHILCQCFDILFVCRNKLMQRRIQETNRNRFPLHYFIKRLKIALLERNHEQDALLRKELASRFDIVEQIGRTLYEREHSVSEQAQLVRLVRKLIDDFSENGEMLLTLERVVNIVHDDAVRKLRDDFPQMKDADVRLLCYIFGGFSLQVISLFMHDSVANVYARKSRLKSRIRTSEAPHKELFLALLG